MHPRAKAKQQLKRIARQHIDELFARADEIFSTRPELAHRYVHLARAMQMRHKVRMPREYKRRYCKHCYHYIRSGQNGTVRLRDGVLTINCHDCKKITRMPFR